MKKVAIVYYSLSGNVEYVAKHISKEIGADLIRLTPKKEFPNSGFKKFFWGGKSAVMRETPDLVEYNCDLSKYDCIIIGTPVWAGTFTPPIRSFIKDNLEELKDKKIAAFICFSGGGAEKTLEELKKNLEIDGFISELILIDPKEKQTDENSEKITEFCQRIKK